MKKQTEGHTLVNGIPLSDYVRAEKCKLGLIKMDKRLVKACFLWSSSRDWKRVNEYLNRVLYGKSNQELLDESVRKLKEGFAAL